MKKDVKEFIKEAIKQLINNTKSEKKIKKLIATHEKKIHFVPIRYRIFGGLLQSMNIQFGNFIEKLLHIIVENESALKILDKISGKRNVKLSITTKSENLIDIYITDCQNNSYTSDELLVNFNNLIEKCLMNEQKTPVKEINIKHDIDVLFSDSNNKFYYLEVKYNDDHDTGKYTDINRKFIKTYIGISNIIRVYDKKIFKPILYYMTQKRMKGNIYVPEQEYIYRGGKLFDEFFETNYSDLDNIMRNIGSDEEIVNIFDQLYTEIRTNLKL